MKRKVERNAQILRLKASGLSPAKIGKIVGLSRERVTHILAFYDRHPLTRAEDLKAGEAERI